MLQSLDFPFDFLADVLWQVQVRYGKVVLREEVVVRRLLGEQIGDRLLHRGLNTNEGSYLSGTFHDKIDSMHRCLSLVGILISSPEIIGQVRFGELNRTLPGPTEDVDQELILNLTNFSVLVVYCDADNQTD